MSILNTFPDYLRWAREEAHIDASKVETRVVSTTSSSAGDDDGCIQRGLFAKETIYPGERILWIPTKALIGTDILQEHGKDILKKNNQNTGITLLVDCQKHNQSMPLKERVKQWERCVLAYLEEFRQFIEQKTDEDLMVVAKSLDFQWRDDDGVALFLMAGQILNAYQKHYYQDDDDEKDITNPTNADRYPEQTEETEAPIVFGEAVPEQPPESEVVVEVEPETLEVTQQQSSQKQLDMAHNFPPSFLPHIEMLPTSFPTCPLYYTQEELARIEGTNCHGFTVRMLQQMQADWNKLIMVLRAFAMSEHRTIKCPTCSNLADGDGDDDEDEGDTDTADTADNNKASPDFCWCHILDPEKGFISYYAYKWALCNIYSRSTDFELTQPDHPTSEKDETATNYTSVVPSHRRVIAPVFDMINHDFDSPVNHAMDQEGNLSVFNGDEKTIEKDQEILLNYGNFPNEKLLLVYGFVVTPENEYDAVQIFAPLSPQDPLYDVKTRILQTKCGIENVNAPHPIKLPSTTDNKQDDTDNDTATNSSILPSSLLSVLRVIGIQDADEIMAIGNQETRTNSSSADGIGMISIDNERSALQALHGALEGMARQLALNMISDDNLQAGATYHNENTTNNIEKASEPQQQQIPVVSFRNINLQNAKALCRSEYAILQAALEEIYQRLSRL